MAAIVIAVLATYCVTTLITEADGPFGLFYKLRHHKSLQAFDCFLCLSVYIAFLCAVVLTAGSWQELITHTFAIAGGAIFLHKAREY